MADNLLVTGGAGFIGSHVVSALIEKNIIPIVVDNLSSGKVENLDPRALFYQQDITDDEMMEKIFMLHKPRYVFHLAAQISVSHSVKDPIEDANINIIGTLKLLRLSVKYGVEKFIFSSTGGAIYGDDVSETPTPEGEFPKPISPYGIAKFSVENYLRFYNYQYGLKYAVLRYANVYGERQDPHGEAGVVAIFSKRMLANDEVIIFGDGENVRDYVYAGDVARANVLVMEKVENEVINIGTGIGTSVNELFALLKEITGYQKEPVYADPRPGDLRKSILKWDKAKELMGWEPSMKLKDGLVKTVEFFRTEMGASE
ncbi:NAD-dependent epimerase/dehydratase family protein [Kosmotoga pacifica]|uniref:UDP-glucose 4-epimerase n=1 Tax=Kosmotoga pacifica TaxID=1330330 RepID=A0A0G2ZD78_9BACT|nr:NAD-dependent epimerase/dehydratase family protein [Kosmotoga pacifica]AKI96768.1 UDP-glucose 4-epimerase [Kosmotoga pacifica]